MIVRYEMPVCDANMHQAVKDILAEMNEHNNEYPGLERTVMDIKSWSVGDCVEDTDDVFWQVVIYEKITDLFYIYDISDSWYFDTRKVDVRRTIISRSDMQDYMTKVVAMVGNKEVA